MNPLARLEAACARIVEDTFARVFPSALDPAHVGRKLVAAMQATPSDSYVVRVNPVDYARFLDDRAYLESHWSAMLAEAWPAERGEPPRAFLVEDARAVAGSATIEAVIDERTPTFALERPDGTRIELVDGITIGRADDNTIAIHDGRVSRHHARVVQEADGFSVVDSGSANGTWVDGKRISRARLVPGATLTVGETHLKVVG